VHKRIRSSFAAVLAVVLAAGCSDDTSGPTNEQDIVIGGLFSLTGNWSTLGVASKAAMEIAAEDVNEYLADAGSAMRVSVQVEDTKLDPALAQSGLETFRNAGVDIVVGPQSSAEVAQIKAYADANDILVVSQSSTASTLAIAGDNILRFTPGDSLESVALAGLMKADSLRVIVPLWRSDAGNAGLASATRARFTALGGTVTAGAEYGPEETAFTTQLAAVKAQIQTAVAQHGADRVAVALAAFDEAAQIFEKAAGDPVFESVVWYGTDGTAQSAALTSNAASAQFASKVGFASPIFGLDEGGSARWQPIAERVRTRGGQEPDAFALAVYDAVWIAALAYLSAGSSADFDRLKNAFTQAAGSFYGATGWVALNDAGDRRFGNFDFYGIRPSGASYTWQRVARFDTQSGAVSR